MRPSLTYRFISKAAAGIQEAAKLPIIRYHHNGKEAVITFIVWCAALLVVIAAVFVLAGRFDLSSRRNTGLLSAPAPAYPSSDRARHTSRRVTRRPRRVLACMIGIRLPRRKRFVRARFGRKQVEVIFGDERLSQHPRATRGLPPSLVRDRQYSRPRWVRYHLPCA